MTKEDFVSLECAKLLKEKGFDEPCLASRLKNGELRRYDIEQRLVNMTSIDYEYYEFLAPTLYEAQKWLRKNHKIQIAVYVEKINLWHYEVQAVESNSKCKITQPFRKISFLASQTLIFLLVFY